MSTRLLTCTHCGHSIMDNELENAVHGEYPYPFDDGVGMCQGCARFRRDERRKLSRDERIQKIRAILSSATAKKMEGVLVDTFTASAIISIYDSMSPENQMSFGSRPVREMSDIAWKMITKFKERG